MDKLYQEFLDTKVCIGCGSQRCEQTPEWIEGCSKWKEFLSKHIRDIN